MNYREEKQSQGMEQVLTSLQADQQEENDYLLFESPAIKGYHSDTEYRPINKPFFEE